MSSQRDVLLFDGDPGKAAQIQAYLQEKHLPVRFQPARGADGDRRANVALFVLNEQDAFSRLDEIQTTLQQLATDHVAALVWGLPQGLTLPHSKYVESVAPDATLDEVFGRLATLAQYAPIVRQLDAEVTQLQRLGTQVQRYFAEIDQEMRLAGRLQRDFLPRALPSAAGMRFSCLYRPALWVSGDIYDVFAIDERNVGIMLADAMGHGTAAALMTMFVRQALRPTGAPDGEGTVLGPGDALANLSQSFAAYQLPDSQFFTAAYAVLDVQTRELRLARGGHPFPLLIWPDGAITELDPSGGLLGLWEVPAEFEEEAVRLKPGCKVIFYTDGIEEALIARPRCGDTATSFTDEMREWSRYSAADFTAALQAYLDGQAGSLNPQDDVTVVVLEVD